MDDGFRFVRALIDIPACDALVEAIEASSRRREASSPNLRNLLREVPLVSALAYSRCLLEAVTAATGSSGFPIRAILFDKTPETNWSLTWHQDLAIAVREHRDVPGFEGWSVKDGVPHVHPPAWVLESMVAVRIHLDDCPAENGALMVLPGSHKEGKLDRQAINRWKSSVEPVTCAANRGDALLMRPLLLHSSKPAAEPSRRRVIHIEYTTRDLPKGLEWHELGKP